MKPQRRGDDEPANVLPQLPTPRILGVSVVRLEAAMSQTRKLLALADAKSPFSVGVAVGDGHVNIGLIDDLGRPLAWLTPAAELAAGPEAAAEQIGAAVLQVIEDGPLPARRRCPRGPRLARRRRHRLRHVAGSGATSRLGSDFRSATG